MTRSVRRNRINFTSINRSVSLNFKLCEKLPSGKLFIVVQFLHIFASAILNMEICFKFEAKLVVGGNLFMNYDDALVHKIQMEF